MTRTLWTRLASNAAYLGVIAVSLYAAAVYSYPLFHTLIELFAIVVAASVAIITWNGRRFLQSGYLLIVGTSFLLFAVIDTAQVVTFPALGVLPGLGPDPVLRLFLIGRAVLAGSFLVALAFLHRRANIVVVAASYAVLSIVVAGIATAWPLPAVASDGSASTFVLLVEAVLVAAFLVSAVTLAFGRRAFTEDVHWILAAASLALAAAGVFITGLGAAYPAFDMAGHYAQGLAFFLVYKAVVETAYVRPYSVLYKELADRERAVRESEARYRDVAETLQTGLLHVPDRLHGVRVLHEYRSSSDVARIGGDFYDVFELDDCRIGFVLGDVSGKGVTAAATTAEVKSTVRAFTYIDDDPGEVLCQTNRVMMRALGEGQFVTALVGVLDMPHRTLRLASAGHEQPVVCRSEGCLLLDLPPNVPLGIVPDAAFESAGLTLEPGEGLVAYTDGLTDTRRNGELFGRERVARVVSGSIDNNPRTIADLLVYSTLAFSGGRLSDDLAVLGLELATDPTAEEKVCRM